MPIQNIVNLLLQSGLEDRQARVYAASLILGPDSVLRISEQAKVKRATTYLVIEELIAMGLMYETRKDKKKLISAKSPDAISQYLELEESRIVRQKENLKNSLEEIKSFSKTSSSPSVRFYSGKNVASTVNSYLTRKTSQKETVYSLGDTDEVMRSDPDILKKGVERRVNKKIRTKVIYSGSIDMPDKIDGRESIKADFKVAGAVQIQKEVMTIMTHEGLDSVGIVIEGEKIIAPIRQLYEMAWEGQELKKRQNKDN